MKKRPQDDTGSRPMDLHSVEGTEGEWVVLVNGKIVAHDFDARKMLKFAERFPAGSVEVLKVLYGAACFY